MTRSISLRGAARRCAGPLATPAVVAVLLAAVLVAGLALPGDAHAAADATVVPPTAEVAPASGGVSDEALAVAIFLPLIFGGCLVGVMLWAVANRVKPGQEETRPMPWWRTGAWYGRRDEDRS